VSGAVGRRYRKHGGHMIQVNGENVPLHALPAILSELERTRGEPLVVDIEPGQLGEAHQRLYATLGVLVRFVPPRTAAAD
jgi:hypothetical protein